MNKNKLIGIIVVILALILGYMASQDFYVKPKKPNTNVNVKKEPNKSDKDDENKVEEEKKEEKIKKDITFLIIGVDEGERSDSLMVCKYFGSTGKVAILSVPRDTRTEVPGYGMDKINHANAYGGAELSLKAVNNLLKMNIENYIRVDYALLEDLVNTIDGVEIYIPEDTVFWDKGTHKFYGEEAVEFVRYRATYYNQDFGRMASQQEFLKQVLIKMKDTKNIMKISAMIKSGAENIDTNISITEMLSYGMVLKDTDMSKIQMQTIPGESKLINRISYIVVDQEQIPTIVEDLFLNDQVKSDI